MLNDTEWLKQLSRFREQFTLAVRDSYWLDSWMVPGSLMANFKSAGDSVAHAEVFRATWVVQSVWDILTGLIVPAIDQEYPGYPKYAQNP